MATTNLDRVIPLLLFVVFLIQDSSPFTQKNETICHSALDCGRARLTCNTGQRLAILRVSRAYHLNISSFDQCASSVQNCSAVPAECCQPLEVPIVCFEDYSTEVLEEAYKNCSAQVSRHSDQDNVTCYLDLPSAPQPSGGVCAQSSVHHNLSSYSSVDYACINASDISQLCEASQRRGNLLYTMWTPGESDLNTTDVSITSCRCSVTSPSGSPVYVFVRALDVRIPLSDVTDECSYVSVADSIKTRMNTTCLNKTTIMFGTTSQLAGLTQTVTPPVDVILSLHPKNTPDIVWIGFSGENSKDLSLTCFDAGENLTRTPRRQDPPTKGKNDNRSSPPVAAAVGGAVATVVFLVIIGFICFYFISKRSRKRTPKRQKTPTSWWEKTRQEDRLAELSQLGPASNVIIDRGRHMGYGKHPPTRRSFSVSETNPPIYIVLGSAVSRRHTQPEIVVDVDMLHHHRLDDNGEIDVSMNENHHKIDADEEPVIPSDGAASGMATSGDQQSAEPSVHYRPVSPEESESVVIVRDGSSVKVYEIPPLTIKELD